MKIAIKEIPGYTEDLNFHVIEYGFDELKAAYRAGYERGYSEAYDVFERDDYDDSIEWIEE